MATASHELRNPLNGVMGNLYNMEELVCTNPNYCLFWKVALNASQLMLCLVNDILDYSQIEAGKLKLFFEEFDPREIINEI